MVGARCCRGGSGASLTQHAKGCSRFRSEIVHAPTGPASGWIGGVCPKGGQGEAALGGSVSTGGGWRPGWRLLHNEGVVATRQRPLPWCTALAWGGDYPWVATPEEWSPPGVATPQTPRNERRRGPWVAVSLPLFLWKKEQTARAASGPLRRCARWFRAARDGEASRGLPPRHPQPLATTWPGASRIAHDNTLWGSLWAPAFVLAHAVFSWASSSRTASSSHHSIGHPNTVVRKSAITWLPVPARKPPTHSRAVGRRTILPQMLVTASLLPAATVHRLPVEQ